jgi:signal transduction histidine kinase
MSAQQISLRRRVAFAFTLLGFVLSLLFSIMVVALAEDYEYILAEEILRGQAEDYGLRLANHLPAQLPRTHRLSGYRGAAIPPRYAGFPEGVSEDEASDGIHVGIFDTSAGRLAFVIDLRDIERLEFDLNLLLAAMIVAGTLVAGWLGWLFAGAALAPVSRLAAALDALPVQPQATRLQETVSHDELGRLAQAIDAYQARLLEADAHEQAFFADASHELRTPIAVVQGATEVLLDDPPADLAQRTRLQRVERGVQELSDLLEAMLGIARRTPLRPESVDATTFLQDAVSALAQSHRDLVLQVDATGRLQVPPREALLLVRGLARRVLQPGVAGVLALRLEESTLDLAFHPATVPGPTASDTAARSDTGHAVALLDRLALRLRWELDLLGPAHVRNRLPGSPPY